MTGPLTDLEREILAIEAGHWRWAGAKETAIRERTGLGATRYYQMLAAMVEDPRVIAVEPVLAGRLRRLSRLRWSDRRGAEGYMGGTHVFG